MRNVKDKWENDWENNWVDINLKNLPYLIRYHNSLKDFGRKNLLKIADSASKLPAWIVPGNQKVEIASYKGKVYLAWNIIVPETQKRWVLIDEKCHFEKGLSCDLSQLLRTPMFDGQHRHGQGIQLEF